MFMIRYFLIFGSALIGVLLVSPISQAQEPTKAEPPAKAVEVNITEDVIRTDEGEITRVVRLKKQEDPQKTAEKTETRTRTIIVQTPSGSKPFQETVTILSPVRTHYEANRSLLHNFGLSLADADDALRAQLELPPGEGVVVVMVRADSLADHLGFKANDILLTIGDLHAKDRASVQKALFALTKEAVPVKLIREGKLRQMSVVGPEHGVVTEPTEYWIGVPVSPVDPTLRAHLPSLAAETGLVVNDVVKDSPAEKAGLKNNDILVSLNSKLLKESARMIALIQASEGKPISLEILRAGKPLTLTVTPIQRKAAPSFKHVTYQVQPVTGTFTMRPEIAIESRSKEANQEPGPDGKIEVTHLLSGQKLRIDPRSPVNSDQASAVAVPQPMSPDQVNQAIQLRLLTNPPKEEADAQNARIEARMKELSTKLDEIQALLKDLKKPEGK
jgi:hypothetical protein